MAKKKIRFDFDVALSFAGEDRAYVEEVANICKKMGLRVFYDKYETVSLWGKDLYSHLREIYLQRARYTVIFISKHYKKKLWTNHERQSAQAKAFTENQEYILPARFDKTQIPSVLPTTAYVNLSDYSPLEFSMLIKQKVGHLERPSFLPDDLDRLYEYLELPKRETELKAEIYALTETFFDSLKLMTSTERAILTTAIRNTCGAGPPQNVHLKLDLLARLTSLSATDLRSLFARLDCVYIKTKIYISSSHEDKDKVKKSSKIIQLTYEPVTSDFVGNATGIMLGVINCIFELLCPTCSRRAIEILDFSVLSTLAGFEDPH